MYNNKILTIKYSPQNYVSRRNTIAQISLMVRTSIQCQRQQQPEYTITPNPYPETSAIYRVNGNLLSQGVKRFVYGKMTKLSGTNRTADFLQNDSPYYGHNMINKLISSTGRLENVTEASRNMRRFESCDSFCSTQSIGKVENYENLNSPGVIRGVRALRKIMYLNIGIFDEKECRYPNLEERTTPTELVTWK